MFQFLGIDGAIKWLALAVDEFRFWIFVGQETHVRTFAVQGIRFWVDQGNIELDISVEERILYRVRILVAKTIKLGTLVTNKIGTLATAKVEVGTLATA